MYKYNICVIILIVISQINGIISIIGQQQPCFAYPLVELTPDKTVHFATTFQGNYYEASHYCRRHCMQLISINSQAEQKALEDYLKRSPYKNENFWTSGNDLAKEGVFVWASTGDRLTYTNWVRNEPDNYRRSCDTENCLHIWQYRNFQWNDGQCSNKFYFICEIRM